MTTSTLPDRKAVLGRLISLHSWMSVPALGIVMASLYVLLRLSPEQWRWFLGATGIYAVIAIPISMTYQRHLIAPIGAWLEGRGGPGPALDAVMDLGLKAGLMGAISWVIPVTLVAIAMELRFPSWGLAQGGVMLLAGVSAGFVVGTVLGFLIKPLFVDLRDALAAAIPDPEERVRYGTRIPLRRKLAPTIAGVALLPVVFAVVFAQHSSDTSNEELIVDWQAALLERMPESPAAEDLGALERSVATGAAPAPLRLATLRELEALDALPWDVISAVEADLQSGAVAGDSRALLSRDVFTWRALEDGRVVVASTPGAAVWRRSNGSPIVFGVLIAVSALLAVIVARLSSNDVSHATEVLRQEAERLASGDLRSGRIWESEDELGDLSRSFETMASSLRQTVSRVSEAADRVEQSAVALLPVTETVSSVTAEQVEAMEQAATSMEEIDAQVRGIASSSGSLNESVEESSSSVLELGASGQQLNDTAVRLHESVEEVSTSIEQLNRSVSQVTGSTESLSEAAEETSASMEEMASSLREVDTSAEETSRLSAEVVDAAESGQAKVRETIEGMEAIQQATETAEQVIRGLHGRTVEIGAIVDVIDDVADETNLLALNAAIIAAQAGEHGRAFSVVADEIKDLAERVLASTKEIGGLIAAVQSEAARATGAIEEGTSSVASGVERSAEAGLALEAITKASRESGTRMEGIVAAVQAQSKASVHVVELMEKVRSGVEQIRDASQEQSKGHTVVSQSSFTMRDVAQQVRGTTEEQARGSARIRQSIEDVRRASEQINGALQEQSQACASAVQGLEAVQTRTRTNEEAVRTLDDVTKLLRGNAQSLREEVDRFRIA